MLVLVLPELLKRIHWAGAWLRHASICRRLEDREDWPVYEINVERCPQEMELTETAITFVGQFQVVDVGPLMHGSDGAKDLREVLTTEGGVGSITFSLVRLWLVSCVNYVYLYSLFS